MPSRPITFLAGGARHLDEAHFPAAVVHPVECPIVAWNAATAGGLYPQRALHIGQTLHPGRNAGLQAFRDQVLGSTTVGIPVDEPSISQDVTITGRTSCHDEVRVPTHGVPVTVGDDVGHLASRRLARAI